MSLLYLSLVLYIYNDPDDRVWYPDDRVWYEEWGNWYEDYMVVSTTEKAFGIISPATFLTPYYFGDPDNPEVR